MAVYEGTVVRLPSTNPVTLPFGATTSPYSPQSPHKGVDFGYLPDDTIYMPCDATVTLRPNNGADGNGVYFYSPGGAYFMGLLHTSKYLVANGQFVPEGTPVAIMGATGNTQGKHLHYAVLLRSSGQYVDPLSLTPGKGAEGDNEVKIGGEDNWYARMNRLHHQLVRNADLPREVFNAIIGQDAWKVIESWSDHPEADALIQDQVIGEIAIRDQWDKQIYNLQDTLKEVQKKADLSEDLQKKVDACLAQATKDEEAGNAFMRWLGKFFRTSQ